MCWAFCVRREFSSTQTDETHLGFVGFLRYLIGLFLQEIQLITRMYLYLVLIDRKKVGYRMVYAEATTNTSLHLVREEEDKEYFETAKNGILFLDNALRVKNLNREAERICGIDRSRAMGREAKSVFCHLGEKFMRSFSITDYDDMVSNTLKIRVRDQVIYLHVDSLKIRETSGAVGGMIVILQDLSALKSAIKQIQTTQMLMSLGELAAGVAHHVRTPLTTISGYLQMMVNRLEDDCYAVRRDTLEMMLDEVSYINNVVKELILFAKPPISKVPFINLNRVTEAALLLTFKEMGGEKVHIEKQLADNLPTITADGNHLQQALMNIMENAMDAMATGGILTLKTWLNSELNMLVVSVADTGAGFDREILTRAFEPFYTTKLDRMGLGLPIAQRIIAEHGGFINISADEETQGTKVHVYIPIKDECARHLTVMHQQILNLQ